MNKMASQSLSGATETEREPSRANRPSREEQDGARRPWTLVSGDFVTTGGMDVANLGLAEFLARDGHPLEVVTHRADERLLALPGVTEVSVPRPWGKPLFGAPWLRWYGRQRAAHQLRQGGEALVNGGNCPVTGSLNWMHYCHAAFTPVLAQRGLRRWKARYTHQRSVALERAALRQARLVICNSRLTARHVIEQVGIEPAKVHVVYYGTDPQRFPAITAEERQRMRHALGWPDAPHAIFIGGLGDRRKGFDVLFAAWSELCRDPQWDVRLAVVGRGAELAAWQSRADAAGLASRIDFLGFRRDVPAVLAACDLMVHPARYEAYGLGVHEASCRGLPAIVSATAGVAERLAEELEPLLLTDADDVPQLVAHLRRWRSQSTEFAVAAQRHAEQLRQRSWDDMAREIRDLAQRTRSSH